MKQIKTLFQISLTKQKDEYFSEFVVHYLPSGFIEALGNPIQLVITGLITVGLAITTGGASAVAQLELALAAAGLALTGINVYGSIRGIMVANEMKTSATTMHEAKKAAKVMAENIAQLSFSVVDLLLTGKDLLKVRNKNVAKSTSEVYLEKLNEKSINKLKNRKDSDSIIRKYKEYFGDNVEFVNELIENTPGKVIYVEPEKLILNYLSKNKINVDSINVIQLINKNTNFDELKKTIDLINSNVKDIDPSLLKSVPLDTPVNKQTAYMKELNAILEKKGMTLERYKEIVLRNIDDTSNLPPEGSEELKQLAETIRSIREEAVGKLDKDVEFRKYITQQDLIKYLTGEKNTVTGFIARECDASILVDYNEIFNSFRLDYPNTVYNPEMDNFIAYLKFKVKNPKQINKIEIPYSPKFGGTNTYDKAPCSGTGVLNSKNGLIIPELKVKYGEKLDLFDGAELHIQTRDGNDVIVGIFNKNKFISRGE